MNITNIHFIINPAVGEEEPILSYINKIFLDSDISWEVSITKSDHSTQSIIKNLIGKTDIIAVYGGDGSVMEVAQFLIGSDIPLAIIPGGTANVMAKEFGIPTDTVRAIEMLKNNKMVVKKIDTGLVNGIPFILRINFGIMADMIAHTDREMKDKYGQFAYGITTLQTLRNVEPIQYTLNIDGEIVEQEGVFLTVTNMGNIGIEGYSFLPDISVNDGLFDVILLDNANIFSILRVAGTTLLHTESDVLKRWKCQEITITLPQICTVVCDDALIEGSEFHIKIVPNSLRVLVPSLIET